MKKSEVMYKLFGYKCPTGNQPLAIDSILNKKDTVLVNPIKARFVSIFAALFNKDNTTLVIEPTISAARIQVARLKDCDVAAECLDSEQTKKESAKVLKKLSEGQLNFLYVTPQRLFNKEFWDIVKTDKLFMIVVDECQCVTEWGHTFCKDYLHIGDFIDSLPSRPVIVAVSAYMTKKQCYKVAKLLHMRNFTSPSICNRYTQIHGTVREMQDVDIISKIRFVAHYIIDTPGSAIVYCRNSEEVETVYNRFKNQYARNFSAICSHDGLKSSERRKNEISFINGKYRVIVSTPSFGFGMDKGDIRLIVFYGVVTSMSEYIRCINYAGTDDIDAEILTLFCPEAYNKEWQALQEKKPSRKRDKMLNDLSAIYNYLSRVMRNQRHKCNWTYS